MKASQVAKLAGYSPYRVRQLADAGKIPGLRVIQRARYQVRRFHDCPALRQWIAEAAEHKGKRSGKRQEQDKATRHPALRNTAKKIATSHAALVRKIKEDFECMRRGVDAAVQCGLRLQMERDRIQKSKGDWHEWLRVNCPKIPPAMVKRYLRLARRAGSKLTAEDILRESVRLDCILEAEGRSKS